LPARVVDLVSRRVVAIVTPGDTPAAPNMAALHGVASLISYASSARGNRGLNGFEPSEPCTA
jgi:hypothetical protein